MRLAVLALLVSAILPSVSLGQVLSSPSPRKKAMLSSS